MSDLKLASSTHILCRIRLIRRTKATMARLAPRRRARPAQPMFSAMSSAHGASLHSRPDTARGADDITSLGNAARDIALTGLVA